MEKLINKSTHPEFAQLAYKSIHRIYKTEVSAFEKVQALYRLITIIVHELTQDERIHFTTQFARVAYVGSRYDLSGNLLFGIHNLRKSLEAGEKVDKKQLWPLSLFCSAHLVKESYNQGIPPFLSKHIPLQFPIKRNRVEIQKFEAFLRVHALKYHADLKEFEVVVENLDGDKKIMKIDQADRNSLFSQSLKNLASAGHLPISLHLINTEIDLEGKLNPQAIILDPDYLVDVTAIASCFKSFGSDPRMHLLQKFLPVENNIHLMIGNIANFLLDEIINHPQIEFQEIKAKLFKLDPLGFALFEDKLVREVIQKIQLHYVNLKKVVLRDFAKAGIKRSEVYLEPSFYSPSFGIQGRLDVFHSHDGAQADIVELKSGKVFRPNAYGLNQNHYIQTILYDLLVKETLPNAIRITSYILYSFEENRSLRFAPAIQAKQFEALAVRNAMVETDIYLSEQNPSFAARILGSYKAVNFPGASGFLKRDLQRFENAYQTLTVIEKDYFNSFTGFIYRELRMAKIGSDEIDQLNGMAGLWLNTEEEKISQFALLNHLTISTNNSDKEDPIIELLKTDSTASLAKYRMGDIVVFYPNKEGSGKVRSSQVFKSTIVHLEADSIHIRLRSQQKNKNFFEQYDYWNLEYDFMESGFNSMFRGLFEFAESKKEYKELVLTARPPARTPVDSEIEIPAGLNAEQGEIFKEIISAEDYYLLWGPPGTGKTSRMIKSVLQYLFEETSERILVLAYTNRAVDELCEAIISIDSNIKKSFLRIGSRYSVAPEFQDLLLGQIMDSIKTRKGLVQMLNKKRIVCGTLASVLGKQDLFALMKFDRVIIDEASQILEPMLVGLLSRFPKRILVGDHLQLPAVVAQNEKLSVSTSDELHKIGLSDTRNSLFERLYQRCQEEKWEWAIGQLSQQGRMHEHLMSFPNRVFYNNKLSVIEGIDRLTEKWDIGTHDKKLQPLAKERLIYIPTTIADFETEFKTNLSEAIAVSKLLKYYETILGKTHSDWKLEDIGIITPFRAQIAKIRNLLDQELGEKSNDITVDTVERYQGGAREVIIISFCANQKRHIQMIQSISQEGVDRKLNVALTRAKEQIIILGNESVLNFHPQLKQLISECFKWDNFWD